MPTRRLLLMLPLAAAACGRREPEPATALPPLVSGYSHLTALRLNVAEVEVPEPGPGAVQVQGAAPLNPAQEMRRMAQERLLPVGASGEARFRIDRAQLLRERLPTSGGLAGAFRREQAERLSCDLLCRLEVASSDGARTGFVQAAARRTRTLEEGIAPAASARAAEELVRQTMDELNVELEYQVRRTLRDWLVEGVAPAAAVPPEPVGREELPQPQ